MYQTRMRGYSGLSMQAGVQRKSAACKHSLVLARAPVALRRGDVTVEALAGYQSLSLTSTISSWDNAGLTCTAWSDSYRALPP